MFTNPEDGKLYPEWGIATEESQLTGEKIRITDDTEPFEVTPDVIGVFDTESSTYVLGFEVF